MKEWSAVQSASGHRPERKLHSGSTELYWSEVGPCGCVKHCMILKGRTSLNFAPYQLPYSSHIALALADPDNICFFFSINSFILAALVLHCCMWPFCSCGKWRLLSSCGGWASHCSGPSCCRAQALGHMSFSGCSTWAQLLQLPGSGAQAQSCGPWACLLRSM